MQTPSPDTEQRQSPSRSHSIREGTLWATGAVAVAACCAGLPLLLAASGGVVASVVVFGAWGLGAGLAGLAAWAVWRRRKKRVCAVDRSPQGDRCG